MRLLKSLATFAVGFGTLAEAISLDVNSPGTKQRIAAP
jgi:hypothetical protein